MLGREARLAAAAEEVRRLTRFSVPA
jgi:hypothetical protein